MKKALQRVALWLDDAVMGFLALAAVAVAVVPALFAVDATVERWLTIAEWSIVLLFAVEYGVNLALANDRAAFLADPWRLLDVLIIVGPLLTLLPQVADTWRSTPALRLLRLVRAVVFGARAGGVALRERPGAGRVARTGPLRVSVMRETGEVPHEAPEWSAFLAWLRHPDGPWLHVRGVTPEQLEDVARLMETTAESLRTMLSEKGYPRMERSRGLSRIFVGLVGEAAADHGDGARADVLLLYNERSVCSLSRHDVDLHAAISAQLPNSPPPPGPFPGRMVCAVLQLVLRRHEEVSDRLEGEVRAMELLPSHDSRPEFFERAYGVKRQLAVAQADLRRLRRMLDSLVDQPAGHPGLSDGHRAFLDRLSKDAEFLHESVEQNLDATVSLIELRFNIVSFEMNKFMRLLAAVSLLGLIPAVVGGLFGMNLAGNPWPLTLPQVTFGVVMGMAMCLYVFVVKGWLR